MAGAPCRSRKTPLVANDFESRRLVCASNSHLGFLITFRPAAIFVSRVAVRSPEIECLRRRSAQSETRVLIPNFKQPDYRPDGNAFLRPLRSDQPCPSRFLFCEP